MNEGIKVDNLLKGLEHLCEAHKSGLNMKDLIKEVSQLRFKLAELEIKPKLKMEVSEPRKFLIEIPKTPVRYWSSFEKELYNLRYNSLTPIKLHVINFNPYVYTMLKDMFNRMISDYRIITMSNFQINQFGEKIVNPKHLVHRRGIQNLVYTEETKNQLKDLIFSELYVRHYTHAWVIKGDSVNIDVKEAKIIYK